MSVMVVNVLLKAFNPLTGPGAGVKRHSQPPQYSYI